MNLNPEQQIGVDSSGDTVVTACPGSGKTRVLTARIIKGATELQSTRERAVALTFTNRAADEIRTRLDQKGIPKNQVWAGTTHSFALEWILRPYAPYANQIRYGFTVADEYYCGRLLREIKKELKLNAFLEINTVYGRNGTIINPCKKTRQALSLYKEALNNDKIIDYDEVLYLGYQLLT